MGTLYRILGEVKCQELTMKAESFWQILHLSNTGTGGQVYGRVLEGIATDFVTEFLPRQFGIKSGSVFDTERNEMSPPKMVSFLTVPLPQRQ